MHVPGDNDAARYHYWAQFDGEAIVAVVRSANPDDRNGGERFDKNSRRWKADREALHVAAASPLWSMITADEADAATLRRSFGWGARPIGDPGFVIAIDLDNDDIIASADLPDNARVEQTASGHARILIDAPHTGWVEAGSSALQIARQIEADRPIVCLQICRADLWDDGEQTVDPITVEFQEFLDSKGGDGYLVTFEVLPLRGQIDFRESRVPHASSYPSTSTQGRPQRTVDNHWRSCADAAQTSVKMAIEVSNRYSIVRIRASRTDYFVDHFVTAAVASAILPAPTETAPRWFFPTTIDDDRYAVIDDPDVDYTGWSVEVEHNGETHLGSVTPRRLWRVGTEYNLCAMGTPVSGWAAPVAGGAILKAFLTPDGERLEVDTWTYMVEWLVESLADQPVALIIDLGPNDYISSEHDEDEDVVCAQMQVMADDVFMVRRSRVVLGHLIFADYSTAGVELDTWYQNDHFDDCTDGYLFTKDRRLAAETVITWFRDNQGSDSEGIGCNYRYADVLIPEDPTLF